MIQIEKDLDYIALIKEYCRPLKPLATELKESLSEFDHIRAVIFDIYGTLFISGSGDIGTARKNGDIDTLKRTLERVGLNIASKTRIKPNSQLLYDTINLEHVRLKKKGIDYPEIDIIEIWKSVLHALDSGNLYTNQDNDVLIKKIALIYELQLNPVWPMPGMLDVLSRFACENYLLGVVSNAQFYTPLMFEALLGIKYSDLGFSEDLLVFSYKHSMAKPSLRLFERLLATLKHKYTVLPEQVVYVGNDLLNDIYPAKHLGMRTVLFAGDKRSLRLRKDNPLCKALKPDVVIKKLTQLFEVLPKNESKA